MTTPLAERVLAWHREHGRHDLPWQQSPTPYRVWVSEIMLQQTQVSTVIPYYATFMQRFADVAALAAASLDDVLSHWSGLGYYSRARNLHRAAQVVVGEHDGQFPDTVEALEALPGIGRSTAGAIVSLAFQGRAAILDGNVKRVLARYHAESGWPGQSAVMKRLWEIAESHLPDDDYRAYSQAMMDLGATLCTAREPACERCPLGSDCAAQIAGDPERYPGKKTRKTLPERETFFLVVHDGAGDLLLERRPEQGIWGGLWCFPECPDAAEANITAALARHGVAAHEAGEALAPFRHAFTHFRLNIRPLMVTAREVRAGIGEIDQHGWFDAKERAALGVPTPVKRLLKTLRQPARG